MSQGTNLTAKLQANNDVTVILQNEVNLAAYIYTDGDVPTDNDTYAYGCICVKRSLPYGVFTNTSNGSTPNWFAVQISPTNPFLLTGTSGVMYATGTQQAATIPDGTIGQVLTITAGGYEWTTTSGTGDVVAAGNNAFTGSNTHTGTEDFSGGTVLGLDKNDVGLNNVDNTSDLNKPISTATAAALSAKLTNNFNTNRLLGRYTTGTGVAEEIQLGTHLSLTGDTLNAEAIISLGGQTGDTQTFVSDTNVTINSAANAHTIGWAGTLAASRLNSNVVQAVVDDTNVTGVIAGQTLTLGWTGSLAPARIADSAGVEDGFAPLDSGIKIPIAYLPDGVITQTFEVFSQAAMLALAAQQGDIAIRYDTLQTFILTTNSPSTLADWKEIIAPNIGNTNITFGGNRSHNQQNFNIQFNDATYWRWVTTLAAITELNATTQSLSFTNGTTSATRTIAAANTSAWDTWVRAGVRTIGKFSGAVSPEGVVTAEPGSTYIKDDTGSIPAIWQKRSGTGNTGWAEVTAPYERLVSATGNELAGDNIIYVDASGGAITLTLLSAASRSRILTIKKIDTTSNAVTIDANGAETIDGFTTRTLTIPSSTMVIATTGTNWRSVGNSVNESGQIKANYTAATVQLVGFTANVAQSFNINGGTVSLSSSPTTTFPYSSPARAYSDLFDATRGTTPTGRLIENPIGGQVHLWRIQGTYANKTAGTALGLTIRLTNLVSGFQYDAVITLPVNVTGGVFNAVAITIADSASIPSPNGYVLQAISTDTDANLTIGITSITRISQAVE